MDKGKLLVVLVTFLLAIYMIVKQLRCIDCTEARLFVDNLSVYAMWGLFIAVVIAIDVFRENKKK